MLRILCAAGVIAVGFYTSSIAQCVAGKVKKDPGYPSVISGDRPPGSDVTLPVSIARIRLRDALRRREVVRNAMASYFEITAIALNRDSLSFQYEQNLFDYPRQTVHAKMIFKDLDYLTCYQWRTNGPYEFTSPTSRIRKVLERSSLGFGMAWRDEKIASTFVASLNRLIYESRREDQSSDELASFTRSVKESNGARSIGLRPPDHFDKYRVLAEQSVNEKDYPTAVQHYEEGVAAYPLWAEGWFNAALIYAELEEYEYAANRMRHYLILMPDAPDAKAAREKLIVWEEKAKNP